MIAEVEVDCLSVLITIAAEYHSTVAINFIVLPSAAPPLRELLKQELAYACCKLVAGRAKIAPF